MTIAKDGFDAATQCKDLATLYPTNEALKSLSCESMECGNLKLIPDGGTCSSSVLPEVYGATTATPTETKPSIAPQLEISIPGLSFPSQLPTDGGMIQVPFLAMYIGALYKYLVGICVIAAALMVVYGGFKYILGASFATISTGKQTIQDALIGLVLIFGSYTLLASLNPATVSPQTLSIQAIAQTAFTVPAEERKRVIESATTPSNPEPITQETAVAQSGGAGGAASLVSAIGEKAMKAPGTVVQDANGNYVAQGRCPNDMIAIPHSDAYKPMADPTSMHQPVNVPSFCIDTYEAPNQLGKKPMLGLVVKEADWYCQSIGKRLCSRDEWERACLGPDGKNIYGYGPKYEPGVWVSAEKTLSADLKKTDNKPARCNYDTPTPGKLKGFIQVFGVMYPVNKPEQSILVAKDIFVKDPKREGKNLYDEMQEELQGINGTEPSGSRPLCITAEGVHDMIGNIAETVAAQNRTTVDQRTATPSTAIISSSPYRVMNFYWSPISHLADTKAIPRCTFTGGGVHPLGYRTHEVGFRCCLNLDSTAGN